MTRLQEEVPDDACRSQARRPVRRPWWMDPAGSARALTSGAAPTPHRTQGVTPAGRGARRRPRKHERNDMNKNQLEGNWKQIKGKVKAQWGKLTDDDLDVIAGNREQLSGKIQKSYGIAQEEAERQLAAFEKLNKSI